MLSAKFSGEGDAVQSLRCAHRICASGAGFQEAAAGMRISVRIRFPVRPIFASYRTLLGLAKIPDGKKQRAGSSPARCDGRTRQPPGLDRLTNVPLRCSRTARNGIDYLVYPPHPHTSSFVGMTQWRRCEGSPHTAMKLSQILQDTPDNKPITAGHPRPIDVRYAAGQTRGAKDRKTDQP